MNVFRRLMFFLRSEIYGLVETDAGERWLLGLCLWEAEDALEAERVGLEELTGKYQAVADALRRLEPRLKQLDQDVKRALGAGADSIAEGLIRRLLPLRATEKDLLDVQSVLSLAIRKEEERIAKMQGALEVLRIRINYHRLFKDDGLWAGAYNPVDLDVKNELLKCKEGL